MININTTAVYEYEHTFSICTMVTEWDEYNAMRKSFENKGFTKDYCEYIVVDNSNGNVFDAYVAINKFFSLSKSKYTILIHQDTICLDSYEMLLDVIRKVDACDSKWAVCGNAGGIYPHKLFFYLQDESADRKCPDLPQKVCSLDENFLLVKNTARLSVSADLSGFHLYGTDICLIAKFLGYTSYVIPFYIRHKSPGNYHKLNEDKEKFIKTYQKKFPDKVVRTVCLKFYLSNNSTKNFLNNFKFIFFCTKAFHKLKYKLTKELL